MSNLRLINETTATSVSNLSITDLFSADFDTYKLNIEAKTNNGNTTKFRFINSSGSPQSTSLYDWATLQMRTDNTFIESKDTTDDCLEILFTGTTGYGSTVYFFNPFSSSNYTYALAQQSGYYGGAGIPAMMRKSIGVLKNITSCTGLYLEATSGTFEYITVKTYGIRVDS